MSMSEVIFIGGTKLHLQLPKDMVDVLAGLSIGNQMLFTGSTYQGATVRMEASWSSVCSGISVTLEGNDSFLGVQDGVIQFCLKSLNSPVIMSSIVDEQPQTDTQFLVEEHHPEVHETILVPQFEGKIQTMDPTEKHLLQVKSEDQDVNISAPLPPPVTDVTEKRSVLDWINEPDIVKPQVILKSDAPDAAEKSLEINESSTAEKETMPCNFCSKKFVRLKGILSHLQQYHSHEPSCAGVVASLRDMKIKQCNRPCKVTTTCPLCQQSYVGMSIIQHLEVAHDDHNALQDIIAECRTIVQAESRKIRNRRIVCELCGCTVLQRDLKRHLKNACKGKRILTDGPVTKEQKSAINALKSDKCKCIICERLFSTLQSLKVHLRHTHADHERFQEAWAQLIEYRLKKRTKQSALITKCPQCHNEYRGRQVITHFKHSHKDAEDFDEVLADIEKQYNEQKRDYGSVTKICPHCSKSLTHKSLLNHVKFWCPLLPNKTKRSGIKVKKTKHICKFCSKGFARQFTLQRHLLQHSQADIVSSKPSQVHNTSQE